MDIDIDLADRTKVLDLIKHVPASINRNNELIKHNTGVYVCKVPVNPFTSSCSLNYEQAEELGYIKLDLLNVHVYSEVKSEEHLVELINREPNWNNLHDKTFVSKVIHIHNHWNQLIRCAEPVNSITRLAMFLACIRPAKKHLIGKPWKDINKEVWIKTDEGYFFKKSHAIAYAQLVVVHMNLLEGQLV